MKQFVRLRNCAIAIVVGKQIIQKKNLLQLSEEDTVSAANDLVGNNVVKSKISFVLLGKGMDNLIKIGDVMAFYDNMANEMKADINEKVFSDISLESFLLKKAKAEYAYCFLF